jgi:hypothetical protein
MVKVTCQKLDEKTDMDFYEHTKQEAISKITPLTCQRDEEAFVHISIGESGPRWKFKIIDACCPEFRELVRRSVYPLAE